MKNYFSLLGLFLTSMIWAQLGGPVPLDGPMMGADTVENNEVSGASEDDRPQATVYVEQVRVAEDSIDIQKKRAQSIKLVERGIAFLKSHTPDEAFAAFTHTKQFIQGELYLFVYDKVGNCYAHGEDSQLIWKNLYNMTDQFGSPLVQMIIKQGLAGGGWVTYQWNNAAKVSYVQQVVKDDKTYIIGAGYYPFSKEISVVNLVKGAVALFNRGKKDKQPPSWAFGRMSYALGSFRYGDLYLYALKFDGTIMAQGDRPGLIGSNALDYRDEKGKFVNKEIIELLMKSGGEGVWTEYFSKRALKKSYAEEVMDSEGNRYFIACGYYPDADRKQALELVKRGYQFMKGAGLTQAIEQFTGRRTDEFRYGDLNLFIIDMKGIVRASGRTEDLIGQNLFDTKDQDGHYFVRDFITKAQAGGGWVNAKINNAFQSTYVEMVDLGIENFVIGCNFFPISKQETMNLMVESGIGYLQSHDRIRAFSEFVKQRGKFTRGDLAIITLDLRGICYAYGKEHNLIWRNLFNITDDNGRPFIKTMLNTARQAGGGTIRARLNGEEKLFYAKSITKGDKMYVVASGYFL